MTKKTILLFSGYNQRAVIAFLRTVIKIDECRVKIIALGQNDDILQTDYKNLVRFIRDNEELSLLRIQQIIDCIKDVEDEAFWIVPSSEYLNRFILNNRRALEDMGCEIPLTCKEQYEIISDKETFSHLCLQNGISVPQKIQFPEKYRVPFVAKPKCYFATDGNIYSPVLILDDRDYELFIQKHKLEDFYYEQYVQGRNYYLLYYFCVNGEVYCFSQENLAQQAYGKSMIAANSSDLHHEEISKKFIDLFVSMRFRGLVMIELRKNLDDYYMIEANPRLWGPSQLFVDAECNFFEAFLNDYGFNVNKPVFKENKVKYFWNGGLFQTLNREELVKYYYDGRKEIYCDYLEWVKQDIYRRSDTEHLFMRGK